MRESFKVNEAEYKVVQRLQKIREKLQNKEQLTDDDYNFLLPKEDAIALKSSKLREDVLNKENVEYQRKVTLRRNELQINQLKREKEFKELQVKEKKLMEFHEGFSDKVKPSYFLMNEIDLINLKIEELLEQNENLKKEMETKNVH